MLLVIVKSSARKFKDFFLFLNEKLLLSKIILKYF